MYIPSFPSVNASGRSGADAYRTKDELNCRSIDILEAYHYGRRNERLVYISIRLP
jgi:hypothetical protein